MENMPNGPKKMLKMKALKLLELKAEQKHKEAQALMEQYDAEKSERELQMQLPRSSCNCASLTVEGEAFIGGDTIIHGDATLSGTTTTITGDTLTIQSKKTDIDGDMLTIQTSGAGTRTGANSAINVSGGVSSRLFLECKRSILHWRRLHVSLESSDVSHILF